jgi:hypothetical protein
MYPPNSNCTSDTQVDFDDKEFALCPHCGGALDRQVGFSVCYETAEDSICPHEGADGAVRLAASSHLPEASISGMRRFFSRRNIVLYRRLAAKTTTTERLQIMRLLAEEEAAFKSEFRSSAAVR